MAQALTPQAIIIGGGAIGLSVAYHLAARNMQDILLLERNQLTSGTSWHAAGIVGPLRATPNMTRLAMYAGELFPKLEAETGLSTGYKQTGGYWLAREKDRMDELHRIASLGKHFGLTPHILTAGDSQAELPFLDLKNHAGALKVAEDANVNPVDLCMAYAKAARSMGVTIQENKQVSQIITQDGAATGIELSDGSRIDCDKIILCAGVWSKPLADMAGLKLPLQAVEHSYVVSEPLNDIPQPFPVIRDLDTGIYLKGDAGGKLVIGGFEPNAKCWNPFGPEGDRAFLELPEDWDQFTPFMQAALDLLPSLERVGIQHFTNGPESFTADTKPLVGPAPQTKGLFVAAGMNSVGIMSSAGIGKMLADWVIDGSPSMDLWEVDIARVDPRSASDDHMHERMKEAVADQFSMHWPFKQPTAGRGLRKSVLYEKCKQQGAVFGLTAGWERALWYAQDKNEQELPYSVGDQPWQFIVEREAAQMNDAAVLLDLSPFSKFDVSGENVSNFLAHISCSNMDLDIGQTRYAPLLNHKGGIDADVTVTRFASNQFRIVSGAATRWRDLSRLGRQAEDFNVTLEDRTEEEAVIGVMGQNAREILAALSPDDWGNFPFSTSRLVTLSGCPVRATRVSFVGELGWELSFELAYVPAIFDALIAAGVKPMGHYALNACRVEKGFYHWGHDLNSEVTPLECGLGWTIDWNKEFIGRRALEQQKLSGPVRRLSLFQLQDHPLILHDEPIWEEGRVVGLTTSGAKGARTGLTLALGMVDIERGEKISQTAQRQFTIEIAGKHYPAKVLQQPPFDPKGERMRS